MPVYTAAPGQEERQRAVTAGDPGGGGDHYPGAGEALEQL